MQIQRYITLDIPSLGSYEIVIEKSAVGTGDKNPQGYFYLDGQRLALSNGRKLFQSNDANIEQETLFLDPGRYVLEVYEESNLSPNGSTTCFDVSLNES